MRRHGARIRRGPRARIDACLASRNDGEQLHEHDEHESNSRTRNRPQRLASGGPRHSGWRSSLPGTMAASEASDAEDQDLEYQITNACNLRCKGCWFFEYECNRTRDVGNLDLLEAFLKNERNRGINAALVLGGEPTLFPRRVAAFVEHLDYVTVATNGLRKLPVQGFEQVTLLVALFGGARLDDELRAIKPSGKRFDNLFGEALTTDASTRRCGQTDRRQRQSPALQLLQQV